MNLNKHTFSIPVMGLGYTIDTPVRVAHFGISSVISLVDDILMEKMREFYSQKFDIPYQTISNKVEDFRAKRITAYLNLVDELVNRKYDELVENLHKKEGELEKYLDMLPYSKQIREKFNHLLENKSLTDVKNWLRTTLRPGSIDVNIMTKLDKANYLNREQLPVEYNDAHAALRGFANSKLSSSLVLSAGMNPRLYSYLENFSDFYPDENGQLRKKITLKVSDFRSAMVQGRFLAKKGIWISEYRVESGLNCGGHAFATQGYLLGPILHEFKEKRQELIDSTFEVYQSGLKEKGLEELSQAPEIKITAQGGVGTNEEHQLLLEEYNLDSVGWGSPFMLVPEACNIDEESLNLLKNAGEEDLYLSDASPLGVHFNNVRGASQQKAIQNYLDEGKPGFPCTKKYLIFNTEYTEIPICTASKQYLKKKLKEVDESEMTPDEKLYKKSKLTEKECLCEGLTNSTYLANGLETDSKRTGVSICPGPNIAYFKQVVSLRDMVDHIYGKINLLKGVKRPNLFLKELHMYVEFLENRLKEAREAEDKKQLIYLRKFQANLKDGINYYQEFFKKYENKLQEMKRDVFSELEGFTQKLERNNI
ncbi:hypothetical protein [Sunxiuqinia dokdonensis]|uniref:Uncharacterized protein n=1 Tax=Sunxiuqinia dokdonensis TaxID=1409788 RepID=A0A0L8VBU4_9BACT|nr:hypothetical protein [Sunxiuqinia dokdonensis]KOH45823.1 hypothetical protein NC99_13740 [Sunxiuqinia dokdonensis]